MNLLINDLKSTATKEMALEIEMALNKAFDEGYQCYFKRGLCPDILHLKLRKDKYFLKLNLTTSSKKLDIEIFGFLILLLKNLIMKSKC